MRPRPCSFSFLLAVTVLPLAVAAQGNIGPSVLTLQKSYHVGIYSATTDIPSGDIMVLAQYGTIDFNGNLTFTGALDTHEFTATSTTFTPNDPIAGDYHVRPNGEFELDFDPVNPGTDTAVLFMNADGAAIHAARHDLDSEAVSVIALEKSSGQTNALLSGTYNFYGQHMENPGVNFLETFAERGTMTFDGAGTVSFSGIEDYYDSLGVLTTTPFSGSAPYTVATDGGLDFGGAGITGGVSANGEVFYFISYDIGNKDVGLLIGVRVGASYDHNDLTGRYTVHGQSHRLGNSPGLPTSTTDYGNMAIAGTSTTTGIWSVSGVTVDSNSQNVWFGTLNGSGTSSLASNGVVTMNPNGVFELAFSDSGDYFVGRINENNSNLWFGMRQCAEAGDYGTGTAGSGGIEPELGMRTFPTLGNANWKFAIIDGLGGAPAIMPIGFGSLGAGLPFSGGLLWLDPLQIAATPFVVLGGANGVPGAGSVDLALPIPSHPSYAGVQLFAQAFVLDPGAPATVAMSRGFKVEFCQ